MSQSAREGDAGYRPLRIADLPRGLQPREQLKAVGAANVAALLQPLVYGSMQERFFVVLLGPRNKVLGTPREIARGQRDEVGLATNLVFEQPMKEGARAIVVAHNHPSGDPEPSEEDIELTRKLIEAGRILNIPVLDHVILGVPSSEHAGFFSMAASGSVKDFKV